MMQTYECKAVDMESPENVLHPEAGTSSLAGMVLATRGRRAMTLVEILIVVVVLGILAMIVMPKYAGATTDAKTAAAQEILHSVQTKIALYRQTNGRFPAVIEPSWFAAGEMPENPFDPDHAIGIQYEAAGNPANRHPGTKHIQAAGSFWYNPANGCFRAYVLQMPTKAETLALYNEVNGCKLTAFSQVAEIGVEVAPIVP